jgi:hypothetical protein
MRRPGLAFLLASLLFAAALARPQAQSNRSLPRDQRGEQSKPAAKDKAQQASASIKGRVIGEGNRPVAGASILALPVNFTSNPQAMVTSLLRPIVSGADGKFELDGLLPGAYTVQANSPGYVSSDSDSQSFRRPGDTITLTLVKGGVITGRVTNSSGDPLVGASVRAIKIREIDDKQVQPRSGMMSEIIDATTAILGGFSTDDRGIYRIYSLAPGYYQVAAGDRGRGGFSLGDSPYNGDAPTYFPSSTIDTAAEIKVLAGDEITGIDIRYREHRGHSISGSVTGPAGSLREGFGLFLTRASSGIQEATTSLRSESEKGFEFDAVLDGEYFVTAMGGTGGALLDGDNLSLLLSKPVRVTVSGGDVTGVELTVEPLASIEGRAVIEPLSDLSQKTGCKDDRSARVEEVVIGARDNNVPRPEDRALGFFSYFKHTSPSDKGEFALRHLRAGVHRIDLQLPSDILFIKSITLPHASATAKPIDAAKTGLALKSGDKTRGLVVTLSEGAAGLRGKVVTGEDNKPPAIKMRVHVVPAEPEAVDEVVRYSETEAATDGSFSLMNIAPGKYWLVAREASEQEQPQSDRKPIAWDAGGRMGLRFEGDASKKVIELASCRRVADFVLKYTPLIKPSKLPATKAAQ